MFPRTAESLDNERVALIIIPRSDATATHLVVGTARWDGHALAITTDQGVRVTAEGSLDALRGFAPTALLERIHPLQRADVEADIGGAAACVAIMTDTAPAEARVYREIFGGMASGPGNAVYLFGCWDDEEDESDLDLIDEERNS